MLVVALQHLLGLGIATLVYALVRRYGLPDWGATLAAAPVLFDPAQILVEQFVMADLLAMVLMVGAFGILLLRRPPSMWQVVTAGLMTGASVTSGRPPCPWSLLVPLFLLLRRVGWRKAGASLLAGLLPVAGYLGWFAAVHGSFNLTNSNGMFLWSRTMSFANCAVIQPPADLQALCPSAQPGHLAQPDPSRRPPPKRYLWNHRTWQWRHEHSGFVPDTAAFTQANNARALHFAITAIDRAAVWLYRCGRKGERRALRLHQQPAVSHGAAALLRAVEGEPAVCGRGDQGVHRQRPGRGEGPRLRLRHPA